MAYEPQILQFLRANEVRQDAIDRCREQRKHIAAHFERQQVQCSPFPRFLPRRPPPSAGSLVRFLHEHVARHALREGSAGRRRAAQDRVAPHAARALHRFVGAAERK